MHKFHTEIEPTCVLAKIPVVLAEEEMQISVSNVACLEKPAIKVDKINAEVRNLTCDVRLPNIIVSGTLHKQIFYVTRNNDLVHMAEDVPFSKSLEIKDLKDYTKHLHIKKLKDLEEMIECNFYRKRVDIKYTLHRATRVQQDAVIRFVLKVSQIAQVLLPQLGGIKGEINCPHRHSLVFFVAKLFDDEDYLVGKMKRLFPPGDAKFRFVSLPAPGNYHLEVVAVCKEGRKYTCYRRVLNIDVEPCANTKVNVRLDNRKGLHLETEYMFAYESTFDSRIEEMKDLFVRIQGL